MGPSGQVDPMDTTCLGRCLNIRPNLIKVLLNLPRNGAIIFQALAVPPMKEEIPWQMFQK